MPDKTLIVFAKTKRFRRHASVDAQSFTYSLLKIIAVNKGVILYKDMNQPQNIAIQITPNPAKDQRSRLNTRTSVNGVDWSARRNTGLLKASNNPFLFRISSRLRLTLHK